jgi:hypothetical protein
MWFDKSYVGKNDFRECDIVLKWDKENEMRGKHTNFQRLWLGPYQFQHKIGSRNFKLKTLEEEMEEPHCQ